MVINLAASKSPSNAKSCAKLGSFCYKWGSRVIDRAIANGKVALTTHEEEQIYGYLKQIQWGSEEELQYQAQLASELISTTQLIEYNQDWPYSNSAARRTSQTIQRSTVALSV